MLRRLAPIVLVMLILGCGSDRPDPAAEAAEGAERPVVDVEGEVITAARLAPVLEDFRGDSVMVERVVTNLVNRLLILQDARDRGLDTTRTYRLYAYEREREKLQSMWLDWILGQKIVVPRDTVETFHSRLGDIVRYTSITVSDSVLCDSLRDLVLEGGDMNRLAASYNLNPMERSSEGRVGPIDRMELRPADIRLLNDLDTGELSNIVRASAGWRFVRLDTLYNETPPPIEELYDQIEGRIAGWMRMEYKEVLFDSLREAQGLTIHEGMPELIASHFEGRGMDYDPFSQEEEEMEVYSWDGGSRTVYQLVENIRNLPMVSETDPSDTSWLNRYCGLLGLYDIMAMNAREMGMDTLREVRDYMDQRLSNYLLDLYHENVIEPRMVADEDEMLEVYEEYRDSLTVPETRVFRTVSAVGEGQIGILQNTLEQGGDPFELVEDLTPVAGLLAEGEDILTVPIYATDIPQPYSGRLFGAELNEMVVCSLTTDRILVFQPIQIEPRRPATFEESYDEISSMLRTQNEEEVVKSLVDSLASVYHIEIDRDFVEGYIHSDSSSSDAP